MSNNSMTTATPERSHWFWLLPALTFLVGLVLGGALIWVSDLGGDDGAKDDATAEPAPSTSEPSPQTAEPDRTITVPGSCVKAAELSQDVLALMDDLATAARDLDAQSLQQLVDELGELEPQLRSSAGACEDETLSPTG